MHAERKPPPPDSACACLLPSCAAKLSGTSECAHIVNFLQNFDYAPALRGIRATEAEIDLSERGGMLMMRRRMRPSRTCSKCQAMA